MARFEIKSKDGNSIRYSGKPRYNGSYLKPSFLEFSEIASSTPIQWEVGDYVDYPRTGMRYRLYSIPQPSKNARKGAVGNSFTYSNVQFFSATKELEIALFRDLVDNDNNIHFSTSPDVATFENVEGIIRRIQVCMNDLYPDRWEIRLASFDANEDAEVIERIAEPRDFALSGGTCLDALSKIYDLWDGIGWFHSHENGKEIITVGYANTRNAGNTTESYLYGKGNGLTAIKKHQTNKEEFATRLYVYGSERNLPARYYNEKNILNAESVDIRNLMLPLDSWGKTDGLPDARKAYLENAEAVAKFGVIPKVHYFDSVDAGADIYPSIEGMTIGRLRKALEALGDMRYYPSASLYPDASKRIDEVRSCENPDDAGVINPEDLDKEEVSFAAQWGKTRKMSTGVVSDTAQIASFEFSIDEPTPCEVVVNPNVSGYIDDKGFDSVAVTLRFRDHSGSAPYNPIVRVSANKVGDKWEFMLPNIRYNYAGSPRTIYPVYLDFVIEAFGDSPEHASYILNDGTITYSLKPFQDETFVIQLEEIGFNIDEMALKGKGKTISMKTGSCAGRSFVIEETRRKGVYWNLICKRQQDNTLGLLFPNSAYEIAKGDRFVLLDIAMPETYVYAASDRLLAEGEKLLARASKIQNHYEPAIDAKVMIESGRTLREGMFMSIEDEDVVDNTTDYIIIDTLSIYEDESAIPTYKVTLRERRKVTYKGTPSATSSTDTQPVEKETNETTAPSFEIFWEEDENGNVFTTRQIRIKNNLIVEGDTASGGNGDPGTVVGATSVVVDGVSYPAVNGVIDMSKAFEGLSVDVDLTDYYTKFEVNELIDQITAGDIDLTNYYTKEDIDAKGFVVGSSLGTLAYKNGLTASEVGALSTAGGTIENITQNLLTINNSASDAKNSYQYFSLKGEKKGRLGYNAEHGRGMHIYNEVSKAFLGINDDGTPIYNSNTLIHSGNYSDYALPKIGGTIEIDNLQGLIVNRTNGYNSAITFKGHKSTSDSTNSILGYLGFSGLNNPCYFGADGTGYTLYHAGNFNPANYLPLSGGTMTGNLKFNKDGSGINFRVNDTSKAWVLYSTTNGVYLSFSSSGARLGLENEKNPSPYFFDGGTGYPLLHSGNVGDYALKTDGSNVMTGNLSMAENDIRWSRGGASQKLTPFSGADSDKLAYYNGSAWKTIAFTDSTVDKANSLVYYSVSNVNDAASARLFYGSNATNMPATSYVAGLTIPHGDLGYKYQLAFDFNGNLYSRKYGGTWLDWKTIAFTDSDITGNAATATKLQTARTIWGQSFDGTGDISDPATMAILRFRNNDNTNRSYIGRSSSNDDNIRLYIPTSNAFIASTKGVERFIINSSGNVLIGTTTDSGYKLDVNGTGRFTGAVTMSSTLNVGGASTFNGDVRINGNLVVTGDTASGGSAGTTTGGGTVLTLTSDIPTGSVTQERLNGIGLTDDVINDLINGRYHHLIINYNGHHELYNISAYKSANARHLIFEFGSNMAGAGDSYNLYQYNGGAWTIEYSEV